MSDPAGAAARLRASPSLQEVRMHRAMLAAALVALACLIALPVAVADSTVVLGNNVLHSIAVLTPLGPTNPAKVIGLGIGLQNGNPSGEAAYLAGEYDPASPLYHQFLDPDQYEQPTTPCMRQRSTARRTSSTWAASAPIRHRTATASTARTWAGTTPPAGAHPT